jgi:hypothetical protein
LDTIVDPINKPIKRLVRNRFEYYRAAWQADESPMSLKVRSLEARPNDYIQALIIINQWAEASWTFENWTAIVDHLNPVYKQDLARMYSLSENFYTLVAYIVETYGGLDRFWDLAPPSQSLSAW